jgi:hypothetical protein
LQLCSSTNDLAVAARQTRPFELAVVAELAGVTSSAVLGLTTAPFPPPVRISRLSFPDVVSAAASASGRI